MLQLSFLLVSWHVHASYCESPANDTCLPQSHVSDDVNACSNNWSCLLKPIVRDGGQCHKLRDTSACCSFWANYHNLYRKMLIERPHPCKRPPHFYERLKLASMTKQEPCLVFFSHDYHSVYQRHVVWQVLFFFNFSVSLKINYMMQLSTEKKFVV